MIFKDNPEYEIAFTLTRDGKEDFIFYRPVNTAEGYHLSRFVSATAQDSYSAAGVTAETINTVADAVISLCNDTKKTQGTIRTDIGVLMNQLKYRTKYPVDQDCALRMAAIYHFIEGENPNKVDDAWTRKKVEMAKDNPDLYVFFLERGVRYTHAYRELLQVLEDEDYFRSRQEAIRSLSLNP